MPPINASVTNQQITASVGETQIDVSVSGGVGPTGPQGVPGATDYTQLTNVPATFPPSAHGHTIAEVSGLSVALDGKQAAGSYAASVHSHDDRYYTETEVDTLLAGKQATGSYVVTSDSRLTDAREWSADTISQAEAEAGTGTTRRAYTALRVFQAVAAWWAGSAAKTKLDGIATGATANATDAQLRDRATHTGTQTASTISDFTTAVIAAAPPTTNASLLTSGTLPDARLSSNIARTSDVSSAVAAVVNAAPATLDTLAELASALGSDANFSTTVTNSLASKAPINNPTFTGTVSGITAAMVGLGNADNTSDASKPVSTAQAAADAAVAAAAAADATTKANAAQAAAVQRANHTGTQTWSTITATPTTLAGYGITDAAAVSHTHSATDLTSGTVATARLGTGTANSTTYLRGDQTWATVASVNTNEIFHPFLLGGM